MSQASIDPDGCRAVMDYAQDELIDVRVNGVTEKWNLSGLIVSSVTGVDGLVFSAPRDRVTNAGVRYGVIGCEGEQGLLGTRIPQKLAVFGDYDRVDFDGNSPALPYADVHSLVWSRLMGDTSG